MCKSQETTGEVTDEQEKMDNLFQQNKFVQSLRLSMHRWHLFYAQ